MNQAAEECDVIPPSSASLLGHRLSLSDLFCTEPFSLSKSPINSSNNLINYPSDAIIPSQPQFYNRQQLHHFALTTAVAQQQQQLDLSGGYQVTPRGHFISPTNPFFADLFSEDSHHQLSQPYLHDQFQWKHSLQPKYRVLDYLAFSTTVGVSQMALFYYYHFFLYFNLIFIRSLRVWDRSLLFGWAKSISNLDTTLKRFYWPSTLWIVFWPPLCCYPSIIFNSSVLLPFSLQPKRFFSLSLLFLLLFL